MKHRLYTIPLGTLSPFPDPDAIKASQPDMQLPFPKLSLLPVCEQACHRGGEYAEELS